MFDRMVNINNVHPVRIPVKEVALDVETLGIDCTIFGITQLAMVVRIDGVEKDRREFLMRPKGTMIYKYEGKLLPTGIPYDEEALKVQGRTCVQISDYPEEQEVHKQITEFLGYYIDQYDPDDKAFMLAYNGGFDNQHLREHFKRCDDNFFGSYFNNRILDPMQLLGIMEYLEYIKPLATRKLEKVCEVFDIKIHAHDAMSDVLATIELWEKLISKIRMVK